MFFSFKFRYLPLLIAISIYCCYCQTKSSYFHRLQNHKHTSYNHLENNQTSTNGTDSTNGTSSLVSSNSTANTNTTANTNSSTNSASSTTAATDSSSSATNTTASSGTNSSTTTESNSSTSSSGDSSSQTAGNGNASSNSSNTTSATNTNSTANSSTNVSITWEGTLYSIDFNEEIAAANVFLNITSPETNNFNTTSLYNGSFSIKENLTSNETYKGSISIEALGFQNMSANFTINTSETTKYEFGQLNMSFKWPNPVHYQNLTGQAVALYVCNGSNVYYGVNATIKIYISSYEGGQSWEYTNSSTNTDIQGQFLTNLPIFQSSSGSLINYNYKLIITPNTSEILELEEEYSLSPNEWENSKDLGKIILEEVTQLTC